MKTPTNLDPRRWAVLGSFMLINLTIQTLWISYAPISGPAAAWFKVDDLAIGLFSMSFMIAFFPLSLPASWVIDSAGFRWPVAIAALVTAAGGLVRGLAGPHYGLALGATMAIAASQPFLLNAWTKVPAAWFPKSSRATAVGLVTLANLLGTALGMVLPPLMLEQGMDPGTQQTWFGAAALVSALAFLALAREKPQTPPDTQDNGVRALMLDGLRHAFRIKAFWLALVVAFMGLGIFNGISTWVESIIRPRGFTPADAGILGGILILGGLLGAVIIPALSDREGKRQKYLLLSLGFAVPGLVGVTFAPNALLLYASALVLGFFLTSAFPIIMQYAAEITAPTPEGTSNGLIQLFGQGAVVMVWLMGILKDGQGTLTPGLLVSTGLLVLSWILVWGMKE